MTVLILEDDLSNLSVFGMVLVLQGFNVLQASNEVGAITLSEQYPQIDLIVCDIAVGTSSGTEIALKLRKARPNLPVLFVPVRQ
jgi:CheY-like chemotaxis protein